MPAALAAKGPTRIAIGGSFSAPDQTLAVPPEAGPAQGLLGVGSSLGPVLAPAVFSEVGLNSRHRWIEVRLPREDA